MSYNVLKITKKAAQTLANSGQETAFFLDEQPTEVYLTYNDVAVTGSKEPFVLQDADVQKTGLVTYNALDGGYPIRKDKKMFPR